MCRSAVMISLCLLFLFHKQVQGQNHPVKRSEVLAPENLKELYPQQEELQRIVSALSLAEKFLATDDAVLVAKDPVTARKIKDFIRQTDNPQNTLFEIAAIHKVSEQEIIFIANIYLYFEKAHLQLYKGSLKIGVVPQQQKIRFPVYDAGYTSREYQRIRFHVKKSLPDRSSNMKHADAYLSGLITRLQKADPAFRAPSGKPDYIISDGYFNALEYWGIQNYFNVSQYVKTTNTVIDAAGNGFYKHELAHYLFAAYSPNRFLNEGLATLFSGEARSGVDAIKEWDVIRTRIKTDEKYRAVFNNADSLLAGANSHEMYFTAAILLHQYYLKQGEGNFFTQLFGTLVLMDDKNALERLKKELGIDNLSAYLATIDLHNWASFQLKFSGY